MNKRLIHLTILSAIFFFGPALAATTFTAYAESGTPKEEHDEEKGPKGGGSFVTAIFQSSSLFMKRGSRPSFAYTRMKMINR